MKNRTLFAHRISYSGPDEVLSAVIHRDWKLIQWWDDRRELYDHSSDPDERNNLFTGESEQKTRLLNDLKLFEQKFLDMRFETVDVELDQELLDSLKVMGYIEE